MAIIRRLNSGRGNVARHRAEYSIGARDFERLMDETTTLQGDESTLDNYESNGEQGEQAARLVPEGHEEQSCNTAANLRTLDF
jgi:hypothetical protein